MKIAKYKIKKKLFNYNTDCEKKERKRVRKCERIPTQRKLFFIVN